MEIEIFWKLLSNEIELPFDIEEVRQIESNCGSVWIDLDNGKTFSISIMQCEGNEETN